MTLLPRPAPGLGPKLHRLWLESVIARERLSAASVRKQVLKSRHFGSSPTGLVIFDDIFPTSTSGFRSHEYEFYRSRMGTVRVLTERTADSDWIQTLTPDSAAAAAGSRLGYTLMLHNAYRLLPFFEGARLPFAFTLYPGGGFALGSDYSDRRLLRVTQSPFFRGVITTQRATYEYVISRRFVAPERILHVFGAPTPMPAASPDLAERTQQSTFNICFVAHKYTPRGEDKGYPAFIALAERIAQLRSNTWFNIVGPFEGDLELPNSLRNRTTFVAQLKNDALGEFLQKQHLIVSPNIPFYLTQGGFDGFPTAACNEAAVRGVVLAVSDPLGLNPGLRDGEEIIVIDPNVARTVERLLPLVDDRELWKRVSQQGNARLRRLLDDSVQLEPRLGFLQSLIHAETSERAAPSAR